MGITGDFTPCGLFQLGNDPSPGEQVFKALVSQITDPKSGRCAYDLTPGTHEEAKLRATALQVAAAAVRVETAAIQGDPTKAVEGIPRLEQDYIITPPVGATLPQRSAAIQAAAQMNGGASYGAIVNALRALLGSNFIGLNQSTDQTEIPANPATAPGTYAQPKGTVPKYFVLTDPVLWYAAGGTNYVAGYANLDATTPDAVLAIGDVVMVQPENSFVAEHCTVSAVSRSLWTASTAYTFGAIIEPPVPNGSNYRCSTAGTSGTKSPVFPGGAGQSVTDGTAVWTCVGLGVTKTFTATYAFAHDVGATVTTQSWPFQTGRSRHNFVIVKAAVAADPVTRAAISSLMTRMMRGVSTWSIVRDDVNAVPFKLGVSPLGCAPLATIAYHATP